MENQFGVSLQLCEDGQKNKIEHLQSLGFTMQLSEIHIKYGDN